MNVKCNLTECIHNSLGKCQAPEVAIDNRLHGYPECQAAEVMGNYILPLPPISINFMQMKEDGEIYYLSDYYEILQQQYNSSIRGFRLQFFPRVDINKYLPTIYDDTASWNYLHDNEKNAVWPHFSVDTGMRGANTLEEVKQIMEAYQHAFDTIRVVAEFFKEGGQWEQLLDEESADTYGWKRFKGEKNYATEANARECNGKKR